MPSTCSFCVQETEANLLAVSSKVPAARICDKCLFKETERLLSQESNLTIALDRLEKELRAVRAHIASAVESRVQVLNASALALDSELGGLREMKRQLQDALQQHSAGTGSVADIAPEREGKKHDFRASAVKRLVDERMAPGTNRAESGVAASGS